MNYLGITGYFIGFCDDFDGAVFIEVGWQVNIKVTAQPAECEEGSRQGTAPFSWDTTGILLTLLESI